MTASGIELNQANLDNIALCKKVGNLMMICFWKMAIGARNKNLKDFDKQWDKLVASL